MSGGANWNNPTTTRNYATEILPDIKTRDEDAITLLGGTAPTNLPIGAIKYNRTTKELQEWSGSIFNNIGIAVGSGGTGGTDAASARTNLGIGSLGTQNSNAVTITGGSISGLSLFSTNANATINGTLIINSSAADAIDVAGGINAGSGNVGIIGTDGRIPAISSTYFADLSAIAGVAIPAGLIAIFDTACPAGWTRVAALDNRFPLGAAAYGGAGGATAHSHTAGTFAAANHAHTMPATTGNTDVNHTHHVAILSGVPSANINVASQNPPTTIQATDQNHRHGVDGDTGAMSTNNLHSHPLGGNSGAAAPGVTGTSSVVDQWQPYLQVVYCRKN